MNRSKLPLTSVPRMAKSFSERLRPGLRFCNDLESFQVAGANLCLVTSYCEIRADYDRESIAVYHAYSPANAEPALRAGRFVPPWSTNRMTWIKPSFLWMMERANWGRKAGQEYILAVRLHRWAWEKALGLAVLTHPESDADLWREELELSPVRVQWDPERSLEGGKLEHRSIQVGVARKLAEEYASQWIISLTDITPLVKRIRQFRDEGAKDRARKLLPQERVYPVSPELANRLRMK